MLSCAKPLPDEFDEDARGIENINDIEEDSEESEDTFNVNIGIQGAGWKIPNIGISALVVGKWNK